MLSESPAHAEMQAGIEEVLAAGERLRASLREEHTLSLALELAPPDSGLGRRFQLARETTQQALSAYNEAVRNCAPIRPENASAQPRPGIWARLTASFGAPGHRHQPARLLTPRTLQ